MLYLAQVQNNQVSGEIELLLLARQETAHTWNMVSSAIVDGATIPNPIAPEQAIVALQNMTEIRSTDLNLNPGVLVLVEFKDNNQIVTIQNAKDWVLDLVQQYLANSITPALLQQEVERAEKWRQNLTLQSQELARRTMELEARQEKIQALEEDLKRQQKQLELAAAQLKQENDSIS